MGEGSSLGCIHFTGSRCPWTRVSGVLGLVVEITSDETTLTQLPNKRLQPSTAAGIMSRRG